MANHRYCSEDFGLSRNQGRPLQGGEDASEEEIGMQGEAPSFEKRECVEESLCAEACVPTIFVMHASVGSGHR
ncbi:hypothetical protein, partial [uncultured Slackia sp.]